MKYVFSLILIVFFIQSAIAVPGQLVKYLGLSGDQIDKIDKIVQDNESKKIDYQLKLQIKHLELRQILLENEINPDSVRSKLEEIAKIETDIRFLILVEDIDISKILTNEQKSRFKTIRAQMKSLSDMPMMMKGMMGDGGGPDKLR
jgi:Spy/CpxP family protein refolding chaperone